MLRWLIRAVILIGFSTSCDAKADPGAGARYPRAISITRVASPILQSAQACRSKALISTTASGSTGCRSRAACSVSRCPQFYAGPLADGGGDTVQVGNQLLSVIHCPGHTPGRVCFYHEPSHLVIVGMCISGIDRQDRFSQGRLRYPGRLDSGATPAAGDDVAFIPGTGLMSSFGEERRYNPYIS